MALPLMAMVLFIHRCLEYMTSFGGSSASISSGRNCQREMRFLVGLCFCHSLIIAFNKFVKCPNFVIELSNK